MSKVGLPLVVLFLFVGWLPSAQGAGCGMGGGGGGGVSSGGRSAPRAGGYSGGSNGQQQTVAAPPRATVKWAASVDAALKAAHSDGQVVLVFFCSLDQDKYVGAGNKAADEYSGKYGRRAAYTVLDDPTCYKALQDGGVAAFAKVSASPENAKEWERFNVRNAGIILCTRSGKPVCGIPLDAVKNDYNAFMQQVRQQAQAVEEAAKKKALESKTDGAKKGV